MEVYRKIVSLQSNYRGVEQLVARRAHNPKVVGSSPAPATKPIEAQVFNLGFFVGRRRKLACDLSATEKASEMRPLLALLSHP